MPLRSPLLRLQHQPESQRHEEKKDCRSWKLKIKVTILLFHQTLWQILWSEWEWEVPLWAVGKGTQAWEKSGNLVSSVNNPHSAVASVVSPAPKMETPVFLRPTFFSTLTWAGILLCVNTRWKSAVTSAQVLHRVAMTGREGQDPTELLKSQHLLELIRAAKVFLKFLHNFSPFELLSCLAPLAHWIRHVISPEKWDPQQSRTAPERGHH